MHTEFSYSGITPYVLPGCIFADEYDVSTLNEGMHVMQNATSYGNNCSRFFITSYGEVGIINRKS